MHNESTKPKTPLYTLRGKVCHIVEEWAGDRVSVRIGAPKAWQGMIIVSRQDLVPYTPAQA
jgi:hypothetical protein